MKKKGKQRMLSMPKRRPPSIKPFEQHDQSSVVEDTLLGLGLGLGLAMNADLNAQRDSTLHGTTRLNRMIKALQRFFSTADHSYPRAHILLELGLGLGLGARG
jgi:hypothetical protein